MSGAGGLRFDPSSLALLNGVIALMMFGVSLTLKVEDFRRVLQIPRAVMTGLGAQFFLFPAATSLATWALRIEPELALGMILVAACPGGAFSNVITWRARGNLALSVTMSAVSSAVAALMTPLNFALYASLNPYTRPLLTEIQLPPGGVVSVILVVLALPMLLGMTIGHLWPAVAKASDRPLRFISLLVLATFVAVAFIANWRLFVEKFDSFFWLVVIQNGLALALGYYVAKLIRLEEADRRAVAFESGIQNAGLGLVLVFTFFPQAGGMALVTAFWGVWQLFTGMALSSWWGRRIPPYPVPQR